jgi:hypothetical protein
MLASIPASRSSLSRRIFRLVQPRDRPLRQIGDCADAVRRKNGRECLQPMDRWSRSHLAGTQSVCAVGKHCRYAQRPGDSDGARYYRRGNHRRVSHVHRPIRCNSHGSKRNHCEHFKWRVRGSRWQRLPEELRRFLEPVQQWELEPGELIRRKSAGAAESAEQDTKRQHQES